MNGTRNFSIFLFFYVFFSLNLIGQEKNCILILIDDLRPIDTRLSFELALDKNAVKFNRAFASAPSCAPSRTAILTGMNPLSSGLIENKTYPIRSVFPYIVTLPEYLRNEGYYTASYGKIFHESAVPEGIEWDEEERFGIRPKPKELPGNNRPVLYENGARLFDWGLVKNQKFRWGDNQITEASISFLDNYDDKRPFFLAMGYRLPHLPWYLPEAESLNDSFFEGIDGSKYDNCDETPASLMIGDLISDSLLSVDNGRNEARRFYSMSVDFVQKELSQFIESFMKSKYSENTLLIIASDHGFHLGEHKRWRKKTLWSTSLHSYLLIYDSDIQGNQVSTPVSLDDIYPTVVANLGLEENYFNDGIDLLDEESWDENREILSVSENNDLSIISKRGHEIYFHDSTSYSYELEDFLECDSSLPSAYQDRRQVGVVDSCSINFSSKRLVDGIGLSWDLYRSNYYDITVKDEDVVIFRDSIIFSNYIEIPFIESSTVEIRIKTPKELIGKVTYGVESYGDSFSFIEKELNCSEVEVNAEVLSSEIICCAKIDHLYPNPIKNKLMVDLTVCNISETSVKLFSLDGTEMFERYFQLEVGTQSIEINFDGITGGIYILMINGFTKKVIVS